ncbi:MAG: YcxB family protein [Crocinitomicaceae bacterium]|nr:YcxB family protein [Crocinitomicaceae bacterium]
MTVTFNIQEKDLVTLQLFLASISDNIRKKRQKTKYVIPVFYVLIAIVGVVTGQKVAAISFLSGAVLWILFYPLWERKSYRKHFATFIREHMKNRFENTLSMEITNDFLFAREHQNENKTPVSEIERMQEIGELFLIRLKGGSTFFIPKEQVAEQQQLRARLQKLAQHLKVDYTIDNEWKWK